MTNGMRHEVVTERERRLMNKINRQIRRKTQWRRTKRKLIYPFVKLMPAKEVVWRETYGGSFPACPRCGEIIYYYDMCIFCGQHLKENTTAIGGVLDECGD